MKKLSAFLIAALLFTLVGAAANFEKEKIVYITFDDGPTQNTPQILEILDEYNAHATFFVLAGRIKEFPDYMRRIKSCGHSIGLHGTSHDFHTIYQTLSMPLSEMNQTNDALYSVLGFHSKLIRTPYGSYPNMSKEQYKILCAANFRLWDWTVDPRDSVGANPEPYKMLQRIKRDLKTADPPIVILHDRKSTANALPEILKYFKDEGYSFGVIDETMTPVNFMELYGKKS